MTAQETFKRCKEQLKLLNILGLLICLFSSMSLLLVLKVFYFKEEAEFRPVLQDTWTPVRGLSDTYVFNAYFTGRDNLVTIVGIGPTRKTPKVHCAFYHRDERYKWENYGNRVLGKVVQMIDHHNMSSNNIEILCPLQSGTPPLAVSVSGLDISSEYYMHINYPPDNKYKVNFSVCTPALHSNYSDLKEVVQSVELDRLFGAEKFTFYYMSAAPEVEAVLRMHSDAGIMKVVPWRVPNVDIHYFAQVSSARDCFYRNMHTSNYIVFKDLDEVLIPYVHSDWKSLLDDVLKVDPLAGAFIFRNSFIHKLGPDVTVNMNSETVAEAKYFGLYAVLKKYRQTEIWPYKFRAKFIVNPNRVINVGIHEVRDLRMGFTRAVVNETFGLLLHYRRSVKREIPTAKDYGMHRFKDVLIDRVDNIYYILNSKYRIWRPLFP